MPWIAAAIGAGGSLLGGALGADSAGDAADAQLRASREAQNLAYSQYLTSLGLQEPWRQTGQGALNSLAGMFGLPSSPYQSGVGLAQQNHAAGVASNTRLGAKAIAKMLKQGIPISQIASMGSLKTSPRVMKQLAKKGLSGQDISTLQAGPMGQLQQGAPAAQPQGASAPAFPPGYNFFREEGQRDLLGAFGAGGQGAFSCNALRGLSQFNQNYADQKMVQPLMTLAGFGQSGANNQQQATQAYGNQGMMNTLNQGDARASGIANQGQMWGQALMGGANAFGQAYGNRQPQFNGQQATQQNSNYLNQQFPAYSAWEY
jgi:hypothetical protein